MGRALTTGGGTIPRDKVVLLTKINVDYNFSGPPYTTPLKDPDVYAREVLDNLRTQTGTDYFDIVLLHHMGAYSATGDWVARYQDVMDMLSEQKAEGRIGALGASMHSDDNRYGYVSPLEIAAASNWVEVAMVRLNPWDGVVNGVGRTMDGTRAQVLPHLTQMKSRGVGLVGMKVFNLAGTPDRTPFDATRKSEAMTSVLESPVLDCFTLGHLSKAQLDENLALIATLLEVPQPPTPEIWSVH
jgi:predicted aldo/keto reductase-like oxidoreductase